MNDLDKARLKKQKQAQNQVESQIASAAMNFVAALPDSDDTANYVLAIAYNLAYKKDNLAEFNDTLEKLRRTYETI